MHATPHEDTPPAERQKRPVRAFYFFVIGAAFAVMVGTMFRWWTRDTMQFESDAAYFFDVSSSYFVSHDDYVGGENAGPIVVWAHIYRFLEGMGVRADPLWGILLNAVLIVAAMSLFFRYAIANFDLDIRKQRLLALLMGSNGLMMMFAGIHLRDCFLVTFTTIAVTVFGKPVKQWNLQTIAWQLSLLAALVVLSYFCRVEAFIVPVIIYLISIYAFNFSDLDLRFKAIFVLVGAGLLYIAFTRIIDVGEYYTSYVERNYDAYRELSEDETGASSLALYLLYRLPVYITTVAASLQVLFVKFPVWREMWRGSYDFYMTLTAVQMLFVAPRAIGMCLSSVYRKVPNIVTFHVLAVVLMLVFVALTSIQVRHFAVVYPSLLLLAVEWRRGDGRGWEVFTNLVVFGLLALVLALNLYFLIVSMA